jgi:N-acetylneuraminate synthase/N,N'-diacetyllegionaminate synthase
MAMSPSPDVSWMPPPNAGPTPSSFQTFTVDALLTREAPKAGYQVETTGSGESQREMLARLELGADRLAELRDRAAKHGLVFFSAPFDEASADALEALDVVLFKVPSGEITNLPLLRHVAAKGRPIILSTGMASLEEVEQAVAAIRAAGDAPLAVLHCLSAYPAPVGEVNLRAMDSLASRFGCPVASRTTRSASRSLSRRWRAARRSSRSTSPSTRRCLDRTIARLSTLWNSAPW